MAVEAAVCGRLRRRRAQHHIGRVWVRQPDRTGLRRRPHLAPFDRAEIWPRILRTRRSGRWTDRGRVIVRARRLCGRGGRLELVAR